MQNAHTWLTSDGGSHQTLALKWQFLQAAPQLISAPFSMEIKRLRVLTVFSPPQHLWWVSQIFTTVDSPTPARDTSAAEWSPPPVYPLQKTGDFCLKAAFLGYKMHHFVGINIIIYLSTFRKPSLRTIMPFFEYDLGGLESNQITTEFHVYCSRYEDLPFVNQRRIPLNKGCQSVYSAGYFGQRHPRCSTKILHKRIQVCFMTQETGKKLQMSKCYPGCYLQRVGSSPYGGKNLMRKTTRDTKAAPETSHQKKAAAVKQSNPEIA